MAVLNYTDRTIEEYAKEIWNLKKVKVTLD